MDTTNNNPIRIQSMDDLLKALIQELTYNDRPIFYIQNDITTKNPFDGSQLRTIAITINYYDDCPLLDTLEGFDAFMDAQGQFLDKFIKIMPNLYPGVHLEYSDLNSTHIFRSYNTDYYLTIQATDYGFFITEYINY